MNPANTPYFYGSDATLQLNKVMNQVTNPFVMGTSETTVLNRAMANSIAHLVPLHTIYPPENKDSASENLKLGNVACPKKTATSKTTRRVLTDWNGRNVKTLG